MTRIRKAVLTLADLSPDPKPERRPVSESDPAAEYFQYLLSLADRLLNDPARQDELQAA